MNANANRVLIDNNKRAYTGILYSSCPHLALYAMQSASFMITLLS